MQGRALPKIVRKRKRRVRLENSILIKSIKRSKKCLHSKADTSTFNNLSIISKLKQSSNSLKQMNHK